MSEKPYSKRRELYLSCDASFFASPIFPGFRKLQTNTTIGSGGGDSEKLVADELRHREAEGEPRVPPGDAAVTLGKVGVVQRRLEAPLERHKQQPSHG